MQNHTYNNSVYMHGLFLSTDYERQKHIKDSKYGNCSQMYNKNTKTHVIRQQKVFSSDNEAAADLSKLASRKEICSKYYVSPIEYEFVKVNDFCATFYQLSIYTRYFQNDLKCEIMYMIQRNIIASNKQLLYLLIDVVNGLADLERNRISHGNLTPDFIVKGNKNYKVIENFLTNPNDIANKKSNNGSIYWSPEIMNYFSKNQNLSTEKLRHCNFCSGSETNAVTLLSNYDIYKSDVFCLGLIILEYGIQQSIQAIYNFSSYKIVVNKLINFLDMLDKRYQDNILFVSTIRSMLQFDPDDRPCFIEMLGKFQSAGCFKGDGHFVDPSSNMHLSIFDLNKGYFVCPKHTKQKDINNHSKEFEDRKNVTYKREIKENSKRISNNYENPINPEFDFRNSGNPVDAFNGKEGLHHYDEQYIDKENYHNDQNYSEIIMKNQQYEICPNQLQNFHNINDGYMNEIIVQDDAQNREVVYYDEGGNKYIKIEDDRETDPNIYYSGRNTIGRGQELGTIQEYEYQDHQPINNHQFVENHIIYEDDDQEHDEELNTAFSLDNGNDYDPVENNDHEGLEKVRLTPRQNRSKNSEDDTLQGNQIPVNKKKSNLEIQKMVYAEDLPSFSKIMKEKRRKKLNDEKKVAKTDGKNFKDQMKKFESLYIDKSLNLHESMTLTARILSQNTTLAQQFVENIPHKNTRNSEICQNPSCQQFCHCDECKNYYQQLLKQVSAKEVLYSLNDNRSDWTIHEKQYCDDCGYYETKQDNVT